GAGDDRLPEVRSHRRPQHRAAYLRLRRGARRGPGTPRGDRGGGQQQPQRATGARGAAGPAQAQPARPACRLKHRAPPTASAHDVSTLELISYGTEVMPASTLRALRAALPRVRLLQTYGLSELGIMASASASSDSLWMRIGGEGVETDVRDGVLWLKSASRMV